MGTVIRVIFREGKPRHQWRVSRSLSTGQTCKRGLTLWRERDDLVFAAVYRVAAPTNTKAAARTPPCTPLEFAPQA